MTRQMIGRSHVPISLTAYAHFVLVWVRSFIEPGLFGPIYLINLP